MGSHTDNRYRFDEAAQLNSPSPIAYTRRQFLKATSAVLSSSPALVSPNVLSAQLIGSDQEYAVGSGIVRDAVPLPGATSLFIEQRDELRSLSADVFSELPKELENTNILLANRAIDEPTFRVVRPEDQLDLVITCHNLRIVDSHDPSVSRLERIDLVRRGQIRFYLTGQSFAEETFFVSSSGSDPLPIPPVSTRLSSPTRLVFDIVGAQESIPFNLNSLLNWAQFEVSLPNSPVAEAQIAEPLSDQTSIEAPYGIFLRPEGRQIDGDFRWRHASKKTGMKGFRESWYTELLGRENSDARSGYDPAKMIAVYSTPEDPEVFISDQGRVRLPLSASQRSQIVQRTHVARPSRTSVSAREFRLSPNGASFDLEAEFPYDCTVRAPLSSWKHISDHGQVVLAKTTERGVLFPFGHEIDILEVTTREDGFVFPTPGGQSATGKFARKRLYVVVRERERQLAENPAATQLPFKSLRIEDEITPPLDDPFVPSEANSIPNSSEPGSNWNQRAFWPSIDSNEFLFRFVAEDWNGQLYRFQAPAIAVINDAVSADGTGIVAPADPYKTRVADVQQAYRSSGARRVRDIFANVAVSKPASSLDTTLEVLRIQFDADVLPDAQICPDPHPLFEIAVPKLEGRVPQLRALVHDDSNISWFGIQDPSSNDAEIFLTTTTDPEGNPSLISVGSSGQTEKTGGISSINLKCAGLSRTLGVVSSEAAAGNAAPAGVERSTVSDGVFDPIDYLGGDSVLFGGIRLSEILQAGLSISEAQMPKVIQDLLQYSHVSPRIVQRIDWNTQQFQNFSLDGANPIFACQQESPDLVPDQGAPTSFILLAETSIRLNESLDSKATVSASLKNFGIQLVFLDNGVLAKFDSLDFTIDESGKTDFRPRINSFELVGPVMSFVSQLQELLGDLLGDSGVSVRLTGVGAEVGLPAFALPEFSIGAFSLRNLSISSALFLSFRSDPMRFRFNFSTIDDPFLVAVGIYAGEGAISLELTARNLVSFQFALGFGLYGSLDLIIAKGTAAVLGGFRYWSVREERDGNSFTVISYEFYVRCFGSVRALGIVTVGVDFYLALIIRSGPQSFCEGRVRVRYSIKIGFFKKSFTLTYAKRFSGSGRSAAALFVADEVSRRENSYTLDSWRRYRAAFVA